MVLTGVPRVPYTVLVKGMQLVSLVLSGRFSFSVD